MGLDLSVCVKVFLSCKHLVNPSTTPWSPVSLRLGHATALTAIQAVIHYRVAASLPLTREADRESADIDFSRVFAKSESLHRVAVPLPLTREANKESANTPLTREAYDISANIFFTIHLSIIFWGGGTQKIAGANLQMTAQTTP